MKLTRQQREALKRVYDRDRNVASSYLAFRRRILPGYDCIMIHWAGTWLGIEKDGYTHS